MSAEALERIVRSGSWARCVKFFTGLDEPARRALAPYALRIFKDIRKQIDAGYRSGEYGRPAFEKLREGERRSVVSMLATASLTEMKQSRIHIFAHDSDRFLPVLRDRRPEWLSAWAAWTLDQQVQQWQVIYKLVSEGLCEQPSNDSYVLGMIFGLIDHTGKRTLCESLATDPALLNGLVWRLFEIEGGGENSLAARDKFSRHEQSWAHALKSLSKRGLLNRGRLLDASLDALNRDFGQFRASWFSRFHESMEPTVDERADRMERYLALLSSPIPPTVSFALKALQLLDRKHRLDGRQFLAQAEPTLFAKAKSTVRRSLKIIDGCVDDPDTKARAAALAAIGLEHPEAEIQEACFTLVEAHGQSDDAALRSAIEERMGLVAPPLRPRIADWIGSKASSKPASASDTADPEDLIDRAKQLPQDLALKAGVTVALAEIEALEGMIPQAPFTGMDIPRLSPEAQLQPVQSLEELVDLFLQAIESPDDPGRIECVLDGVARLGYQRPSNFRTLVDPIDGRFRQLAKREGRFSLGVVQGERDWGGPLGSLLIIAEAWLNGKLLPAGTDETGEVFIASGTLHGGIDERKPAAIPESERFYAEDMGPSAVFFRRNLALARRVMAKESVQLLSTPTHRGGWIAGKTLVGRSLADQGAQQDHDPSDQVLALLRLAPDGREAALADAAGCVGEWGCALRYALNGAPESIGPSAPLWVAAARARSAFGEDDAIETKFPGLGPGAGMPAELHHREGSQTWNMDWPGMPVHTTYGLQIDVLPEPPPRYRDQPRKTRRGASLLPTVLSYRFPDLPAFFWDRMVLQTSLWEASIWPADPTATLAASAFDAAAGSDGPRPAYAPIPVGYALLLEADVPVNRIGRLLLCFGLNARDAAEGQTAVDVLIAAIEDGRLDGMLLGESLADWLYGNLIKPKRWAARLREAAAVSPLHGQAIRQAIDRAVAAGQQGLPRDGHALLELLYGLCVEAGETVSPESRARLVAIKGSSKAATLAAKLAALIPANGDTHRRAAVTHALRSRIERVERWAAQMT